MGQENDNFIAEKRRIFFILILFDISYFLRFIWDLTIAKIENSFVYLLLGDLVYLLCDGFTLLALLILHRKSFLNKVSQEEEGEESA